MADLNAIKESLIAGKAMEVRTLVQKALDEKVHPQNILNEGLIAGMDVVGVKFKNNEFYIPEVLIAARAMNAGLVPLEPALKKAGVQPLGEVAIGTVKGDLHDIGKNLVVMMWKGAGFQVNDLGIDCPPEKFIEAAKKGSQLIGMSALLTTTMPAMKTVVDALNSAGLKGKVKTLIGGAPITQNYADEIGADGYAPDAASAADKAKELLGI
ncbi:methyltransferase [bacterium Unc6]|nr:methyltransferase [bacterium Unc6]